MHAPISLCSGLRTELRGFALLRESFKLVARAAVHRRQTSAWLHLLNSHPLFAQMLPGCPRLVNKIYRNYLSTRLGCDERLDALRTHYATVIDQGLSPLVARAALGAVEMCRLTTKDGHYRVQLRAGSVLCREGELIFQLLHEQSLVYSVACAFVRDGVDLMLAVGCLQGTPGPGAQDRVRDATRALHGMRPKNLLMKVLRQFGHEHGCSGMLLVSNANRVVTTAMRQGKVHADYDSLWAELGAVRRTDGDFAMACAPLAALDLSEIASKKRSEAKKRHDMLTTAIDDMAAQVRRSQRALTPLRLASAPEIAVAAAARRRRA